jgi:hypothetical protein
MAEGAGYDTLWGSGVSWVASGLSVPPSCNLALDLGNFTGIYRRVLVTVLLSATAWADTSHIGCGLVWEDDDYASAGGLYHGGNGNILRNADFRGDPAGKLVANFQASAVAYAHTVDLDGTPTLWTLVATVRRGGTTADPRDTMEGGGNLGTETSALSSYNRVAWTNGRNDNLTIREKPARLLLCNAWPGSAMVVTGISLIGGA